MEQPVYRDDDEIPIGSLFKPLIRYRHVIWQGTLGATLVTALLGVIVLVWQPSRRSVYLEFRPVFTGASDGRYPNQTPFAGTDIVDETIIGRIHAQNGLEQYCSDSDFRSGLIVQQSSPDLRFLDSDYQARLADTRLSAVDRERLRDDYEAARRAVVAQFRLAYIEPLPCRAIPSDLLQKALPEVLDLWAQESEQRRGVMRARVAVLTPAVFDWTTSPDESLLVRADLIRGTILRVVENILEVEKLPGSELIRAGEQQVSLREVRVRIEDLIQRRLEPVIAVAARGLGRESIQWLEQRLASASVQQRAADQRVEAYRSALREYSGVSTAPPPSVGDRREGQTPADVQALTPQIDRTFIDRLIEMSEGNAEFRQEITRSMMDASVEAVSSSAAVEHYRVVLNAIKSAEGPSLSRDELVKRLDQITQEAKDATRVFNQIYEEFSRVAFRAGPAMYRIERPPDVQVLRAFTPRYLAFLVLGVLLATPLILAIGALVHHYGRRFIRGTSAEPTQSA
jgi:hypothetical protein